MGSHQDDPRSASSGAERSLEFEARSLGFEDGFIAGLEETKRGQDHAEALLTALRSGQTRRAV